MSVDAADPLLGRARYASLGRTRQCQLCSFPLSRALNCQSLQRQREYSRDLSVPVLSETARERDVTDTQAASQEEFRPAASGAAIKSAEG